MNIVFSQGCLLVIILAAFCHLTPAQTAAPNPAVWQLLWRDEFDGSDNSPVDSSKWTAEIGGHGWGNNELEYYTDRTQNAALQSGTLAITARKETYTGADNVTRQYTSARLITKNKFAQQYGRFEARIKIPYGQGIWPAFWMLGDNIDAAGWPACGEIDIMENIGREPAIVHGTIHGPGHSGAKSISAQYSLPNKAPFADDYHTYAVEWEPNALRFYVDGVLYTTRTPADLPSGATWVYDRPFFLLLNVAVGGSWPGNPDATTIFPQTMKVDYVRVYRRAQTAAAPQLFTVEGTNRGLALDSVTMRSEPFAATNAHNLSQDARTRLLLFAANLELMPGDDPSALVRATAEDAQGRPFGLFVEHVGKIPDLDWVTEVVVRIPDELANAGEVSVQVSARGQASNKASLNLTQ
ncbi:MAG TPA: glycoside hydrolase family 16 protein [Pyrinomonadaceae bacterium]|nr:glycoside hydrolase family 16 protein [Pyrinomonadaceae bacterium]